LAITVLALLLGGGTWFYRSHEAVATEYQTALVSRGDLTQAVTATGQINPVISVQVGSQISGMIQKLWADYNSHVRSGQIIAQIDAATYRASLTQAEGDLANARAALELARVKASRAAELRTKDLIPQSDADQSLADLHQAEAMVTIKEAALQKARIDVDRCTIVAPIDGIVISRSVDVGQTVAASLSAPTLFVIADNLTRMQINANVAEADIGGILSGQDVDFTVDAYPGQTFTGKVVQVRNAPVTVQNVVTYDTIIGVANPDLKLKPGMTANVSIVITRRKDTLTLPNAALRFRPSNGSDSGGPKGSASSSGGGGRSFSRSAGTAAHKNGTHPAERTIYILPAGQEKGTPVPVKISTGISDGISTEVIEGLKEGDRVVTGQTVSDTGDSTTSNPFSGQPRRF
jgi:HlyD family secretion protein